MRKTQKIYLTEKDYNKLVLKEKIILEEISSEVQSLLDAGKYQQAWDDINNGNIEFNGTKEEAQAEVIDYFIEKTGLVDNITNKNKDYISAMRGFFGKKGFEDNPFFKYFKDVVPNGGWDYNKLAAISNLYSDRVISDNDLRNGIVTKVSLFNNNPNPEDVVDLVTDYKNYKEDEPVDQAQMLIDNPGIVNQLKRENPDSLEEIRNALRTAINQWNNYKDSKSSQIKETNYKSFLAAKEDLDKLLDKNEISGKKLKSEIFFSDEAENEVRKYSEIKNLIDQEKLKPRDNLTKFKNKENPEEIDVKNMWDGFSETQQKALVNFINKNYKKQYV